MKKLEAEKVLKIFTGTEKNFEKYSFYKEIKNLKKLCKMYGISVEFRPFLARGLSYYNGSVFEVWSDELRVSLAGGGSYLVGDIQATGISFGFEPISLLSKIEGDVAEVLVLSLGEDRAAIDLAENLRKKGVSVNLLMDKAVGKGLEYANIKGIIQVVFVGKEEIKIGKFKIRNMVNGDEKMLSEKGIFDMVLNKK